MDREGIHSENANIEVSFAQQDWIRLRDSWNAICSTWKVLNGNLSAIDSFVEESVTYRHYVSCIQNKRIYLQCLKERIRHARRRLRATQIRLGLVIDEECEYERNKDVLNQTLSNNESELAKLGQDIAQLRQTHLSIRNELIFRRRFMIFELYKIFFSNMDECVVSDRKRCNCSKFDVIRGLHLPQANARIGHPDVEVFAASSFVVLVLDNLSQILNFPLKHVLYFYGSRSFITTRYNSEVLPFFNPSMRKLKDRLDRAFVLLDNAIIAVRTDAGVLTRERGRSIYNLKEFLLSCLGQTTIEFIRLPVNSASDTCLLMKTDANDSVANAENIHHPTVEFVERMSKDLSSLCIPEDSNGGDNSISVLDVISPKKL